MKRFLLLLVTSRILDVNAEEWWFSNAADLEAFDIYGGLGPKDITPGGLVLKSDNGTAKALLSKTTFTGDFVAALNFTAFNIHPAVQPHYEARLLLTISGLDASEAALAVTQFANANQSGSNSSHTNTWFYLIVNGSATQLEDATSPRMLSAQVLLVRRKGNLSAWHSMRDGSFASLTYPQSSLPFSPAAHAPVRFGPRMDPNYNLHYRVTVTRLAISADQDGDTLCDDEESLLGTSMANPDTDGDGVDDFDDILPLDKNVASIFNVSMLLGLSWGVSGKLAGSAGGGAVVLVVNNSLNNIVPINVTLPGLRSSDVVVVTSGASSRAQTRIRCRSDGFRDVLAAFGRRVYTLPPSWNSAIVDPQLAQTALVLTAGTSSTASLDLSQAVVMLRTRCSWRWLLVHSDGNGIFSAEISQFSTLVVKSVSAKCGAGNVTVRGSPTITCLRGLANDVVELNLRVTVLGSKGPNVVTNPGFEQVPAPGATSPLPGWNVWTWSGTFLAKRTTSVAFSGKASAMMQGWSQGWYVCLCVVNAIQRAFVQRQ